MSIHVTQISVDGFDDNLSYIIHDSISKEAYVIDPSGSFFRVKKAVEVLSLQVIGILLTHTHGDHIDALDEAVADFNVPVYVHAEGVNNISVPESKVINDGDCITLGGSSIDVLYTPGHSKDSVCLLVEKQTDLPPQLVSGDTLFVDGCGRSFYDVEKLYESLVRLRKLPAETVIYPGHDYGSAPSDTLENQLNTNKYLLANTKDDFVSKRVG